MRFEKIAVLAGVLMLFAVATDATAQRKDGWVELGCQTVSFGVDRDILRVGNQEGRFKAIRLHARGAGIELLDMKVVYGNNEIEDIRVRRVLKRGERTRPVNLKGWERNITQVELFYRSLPNYRGREALVCLEGIPGKVRAVSAASGRWVDLGCKSVAFNVDRDVVRVGRRDGRYKAVRVHARGGDVEMLDLKVIYGNGSVDDIQVRQVMKRGSRSRVMDLQGRDRNIDRVEMVYRSLPNYKGREALICIEGLQ